MNKKVVLIDDDEDEQEFFSEALTKTNLPYEFTFMSGVKEALTKLQQILPDYIFIDYNMPGINGLDGIKLIKTIEPLDTVPVILYTTGASKNLCDKAMAEGAADCIKKSDSIPHLSSTLGNLFQKLHRPTKE